MKYEPEWGSAVLLIVTGAPGKGWPGMADSLAAVLKEYHKCYNTTDCQIFIYFREAIQAGKM